MGVTRILAFGRALVRLLTWPFIGEIQHPQMSSDEAKEELDMMTLAHRDRSGGGR
jgi:hypothetical protein